MPTQTFALESGCYNIRKLICPSNGHLVQWQLGGSDSHFQYFHVTKLVQTIKPLIKRGGGGGGGDVPTVMCDKMDLIGLSQSSKVTSRKTIFSYVVK